MFRKILIANRGEIAVRVIRACRDLHIVPVAVYSEADREALHVRAASEAYPIGPAPATESYLNGERIVETAHRCGADAIHPGYGFLSENDRFADLVRSRGIVFIGPTGEAMRRVGEKTAARALAKRVGVPIVPGTVEPIASDDEAAAVAEEIGYPVMVKAAAGGGGKGMRTVASPAELRSALRSARSEARSAFGDESIYVEKVVIRPRHIEMQILADGRGDVVWIGERECSIQRRHQKVVEEAPSPVVDAGLRGEMGEAAVAIARAAGYTNAGTVEFLLDPEGRFYFLEVNARLQVEHPVTEMVTGIDLVREQIRIAAGERLRLRQEEIQIRGHAIECRIYAEDPDRGFMPSPGRITLLRFPSGPGVRNEIGVYEGGEVPIHYDPLISKLILWGADRDEAVARMTRALYEYQVLGIRTTVPFHRRVMKSEAFRAGRFDTSFIDESLLREPETWSAEIEEVAILAAALHRTLRAARVTSAGGAHGGGSGWKEDGRMAGLRRPWR